MKLFKQRAITTTLDCIFLASEYQWNNLPQEIIPATSLSAFKYKQTITGRKLDMDIIKGLRPINLLSL